MSHCTEINARQKFITPLLFVQEIPQDAQALLPYRIATESERCIFAPLKSRSIILLRNISFCNNRIYIFNYICGLES